MTAEVAKLYSRHGFTVVCQDVIIGPILNEAIALYDDSLLHLFVLSPVTEIITKRELAREKSGYGSITMEELQEVVRKTPRIGHWIDSSDQTVDETVREILDNLAAAQVQTSEF